MPRPGKRVFSLLVFIFFLFTFLSSTQFSLPAYAGKASNGNYTGYFMIHPSTANKKINGDYTMYDVSDPVSGKVTNGNYTAYLGMVGIWAGLLGGSNSNSPIISDVSSLKIERDGNNIKLTWDSPSNDPKIFISTTLLSSLSNFVDSGIKATDLGKGKWEAIDIKQCRGNGDEIKFYQVTTQNNPFSFNSSPLNIVGKYDKKITGSTMFCLPFEYNPSDLILDKIIGKADEHKGLASGDEIWGYFNFEGKGWKNGTLTSTGWTSDNGLVNVFQFQGFWYTPINTTERIITFVGNVPEQDIKIKLNSSMLFLGNPYPTIMDLDNCGLKTTLLEGNTDAGADYVYPYDTIKGGWHGSSLIKGKGWDGTDLKIRPAIGFWISNIEYPVQPNKPNTTEKEWIFPRPY